jgi:L-ascorbate metabolism protein UlaG (beta-lactamase superfamily)
MSTTITYAGHSALLLDNGKTVVGIDPWLEGNPLCPEPLQNPKSLDIIVLTHGHSDHTGDVLRLAKHYGAKVVATFELAMILIKEGVPEQNVVPMNKGGTVVIDGVSITLTHALHSNSYDSADSGTLYAGEACGAVVSTGGTTFYHAGDTCMFSDISLIRDSYRPEIAFLPIGDRFTMGPHEAALAAAACGAKLVIPIHFATFPELTGTPAQFEEECALKGVICKVMKPGELFAT